MDPEYQAAQRAYMRYHNMNPIFGISSKYVAVSHCFQFPVRGVFCFFCAWLQRNFAICFFVVVSPMVHLSLTHSLKIPRRARAMDPDP